MLTIYDLCSILLLVGYFTYGGVYMSHFMFSNCSNCGALFTSRTERSTYCKTCNSTLSEPLTKVKNYIIYHPGSSIIDVVKATGVDFKIVQTFMRQGAISLATKG